jgi:Family of unknown function (DUF6920)
VASVPPPVRRFFERALTPGQRVVAHAACTQAGSFLVRAPRTWRPFRAVQTFDTGPPAFAWDARIRALPGVAITVRDTLADGQGAVSARLMRLVTLAAAGGTPEVAAGALQRYLAEAVLLPTALLPREGVAWAAVDDRRARATLTAGPTTASLEFAFGDDGLVESVFAPDRPRDLGGGRSARTPWRGRWYEEVQRDGMRVPSRGEVEWILPEGPLPYWRADVTDLTYRYR